MHEKKSFATLRDEFIYKHCSPDICNVDLYHYTNLSSFIDLIEKKEIWFVDVRHSNDLKEFKHGLGIFSDLIKTNKYFVRSEGFEGLINDQYKSPAILPFIFCMSEERDTLSQWRGYANFGKGLNLGLDLKPKSNSVFLKRVIYNLDDQIKLATNILEEFDELVKITRSMSDCNVGHLFIGLFQAIVVQSLCFKDKTFAEEKEWRLIYIHPADDVHQTYERLNVFCKDKGNEFLRMHSKMELNLEDLKSITLGPATRKETEESIYWLNKEKFSGKLNIEKSLIPFRC